MIIKNAQVFSPQNTFEQKDLFIQGERFSKTPNEASLEIDATDLYAIPGLTDIHIHGSLGTDFCDGTKESLENMGRYLLKNGITSFVPTSMTLPVHQLKKIFSTLEKELPSDCATPLGIHMEGPFLSKEKKGAQNSSYLISPEIKIFKDLNQDSKNKIKLVDIAPELPGAMEFITALKDDLTISLAHTTANYETALEALQSGASHITHLYNAMIPGNHREPGVPGAAFDHPHTTVELICDGIHIHPSMIRQAFQLFTDERIILISDSMMATGMTNGVYSLGGQDVNVTGNKATLTNGTIAGSATNLMNCLRLAVSFGIPLLSAIKAAAVNPIKLILETENYGTLEPGKYANLVLLDKDLAIKGVISKGKLLD